MEEEEILEVGREERVDVTIGRKKKEEKNEVFTISSLYPVPNIF